MERDTGWRGARLDPADCLSLDQILHSFSAPISEEHAWAVIHQVRVVDEKMLGKLHTFWFPSKTKILSPTTSRKIPV